VSASRRSNLQASTMLRPRQEQSPVNIPSDGITNGIECLKVWQTRAQGLQNNTEISLWN